MAEKNETDPAIKDRLETGARRAKKKATRARKAAPKELSMKSFSPALVGFVRGLLIAAATGALNYVIAQLTGVEGDGAAGVGVISTVLVGALRSVEGLLDLKAGAPRQARMLGAKPVSK